MQNKKLFTEEMGAIDDYIDSLTKLGHPVVKLLRPPVDPAAVLTFERETGLKLPSRVAELFAAHDGTEFSDDWRLGHGQFVDGFYLMSFEEALVAKELIDEQIEDYPFVCDQSHAFDGRSMLPFLSDGCGDHVVVDVSPDSERFGSIGTFLHADDSRSDEFPSFDAFLSGHAEAVREGVYHISAEGYLEAPFERLEPILERHRSTNSEQDGEDQSPTRDEVDE